MNPHISRASTVGNSRLWCTKYRISPRRGRDGEALPYLFEREIAVNKFQQIQMVPLNYLADIYDSLNRLENLCLAIKKGRQARISEFSVNATMYLSDVLQGIRILYVLQDKSTAENFVKERIDEPIGDSPYLSSLIMDVRETEVRRRKEIDSLAIKRFRHSWFHMLYSTGRKIHRSPSGDILIFDEYDAHDMDNETSFVSAIDDSDIYAIFYISTPTLPDYGIDQVFKTTSMGVWTINCATCLQNFVMDSAYYFGNGVKKLDTPRELDGALRIYICPHCGAELKNADKQLRGKYIHQAPELIKENRIGFSFSSLILPHVTADKAHGQYLDALRNPGGRKKYINEKLGEACIDEEANAHLNFEIMKKCEDPIHTWKDAGYNCMVGVDWGKDTHVTILKKVMTDKGPKIQLLNFFEFIGTKEPLHGAKKVAELLTRFVPSILVCDFGAGQEQNKYLQMRFGSVFWAAVNVKEMKDMNPQWNEKKRTVNYDLSTLYTVYASHYASEMMVLPKFDRQMELFIQHHSNAMLIDPNQMPGSELPVKHLRAVQGEAQKILGQTGPIHILSSAMFAFMQMMGMKGEELNFSELSDKQVQALKKMDTEQPRSTRRFTRDDIGSLPDSRQQRGVIWRP